MLPLATPLACSRVAEVVAEVAAVVDELVAAVSNGQQHSSAEVNDDSSSPTEDEDSDNAEADALVAGEAASNEDGAAAGAAAKTPQPAVSDALPTSVKKAIEAHEARATWVDSACEGADELMPLPWRGTDNVYVKLARKIEPRDKSAAVKSIGQKQIASIGGVEHRVMGALLIHALTPEVSARAHCLVCAICSLCALTTADVPM